MEDSVSKATLPYKVTIKSKSKAGVACQMFYISLVVRRGASSSTEMAQNSFVGFANNRMTCVSTSKDEKNIYVKTIVRVPEVPAEFCINEACDKP